MNRIITLSLLLTGSVYEVLAQGFKSEVTTTQSTSSGFWTTGPIVALGLGVIACGLCVWLFLKVEALKKNLTDLENSTKKNIKTKTEEVVNLYKSEIKRLNNQINDLKQTVSVLSSQIGNLKVQPMQKTFENLQQEARSNFSTKKQETKQETALTSRDIYFGPPRGSRFTGGRNNFTPGQSIYRIKDNGKPVVEFSFAEQKEALSVALRSISDYIESACIIVGNQSPNPSKVITVKPGLVKKEGNDWIIENKAHINLI